MQWLQLEANPEILTEYGRELGMSVEYSFNDLISLEKDVLEAVYGEDSLERCKAILLVAPIEVLDTFQSSGLLLHSDESKTSMLTFIKQTIDNACGAIALFHALTNSKIGTCSLLEKLKSIDNATLRGDWLEQNPEIGLIHEKFASTGDTNVPGLDSETNLHFVAMVRIEDDVPVWFDGRKTAPLLCHPSSPNGSDFITNSLNVIKSIIDSSPDTQISALALLQV